MKWKRVRRDSETDGIFVDADWIVARSPPVGQFHDSRGRDWYRRSKTIGGYALMFGGALIPSETTDEQVEAWLVALELGID